MKLYYRNFNLYSEGLKSIEAKAVFTQNRNNEWNVNFL